MSDRRRRPLSIVLSCEHGGNAVPARYRSLFATPAAQQALDSHRGWDIGSLTLARSFAKALDTPLHASHTSRLLIELNRSVGHPRLFSAWSRVLDESERRRLIDEFYTPHRDEIVAAIEEAHAAGRDVLHLSVHTFTPDWDGVSRTTDVGLLFDPQRSREAALCAEWQRQLKRSLPELRTHRNRPYRGTSDGLTTALRRRFPAMGYLGIELEVNQRFFLNAPKAGPTLAAQLAASLKDVLSACETAAR